MDIAALSMILNQSRVQQSTSTAVMKLAIDTAKQNATQTTEMMNIISINPNLGNNLDVSA